MGLWDRARSMFRGGRVQPSLVPALAAGADFDLPLHVEPPTYNPQPTTPALAERREAATTAVVARRAEAAQATEAIGIGAFGSGLGLDPDDYKYRKLTGNSGQQRRDLTPLQQDRMLEICWYLWESNAFAHRLITLMTDLILADGVQVTAVDERIQEQVDLAWNHRVNQLKTRTAEFHNSLSVNGELILTVAVNPITGVPVLGFIDPYQVKTIEPVPDNVLVPDNIVLKAGPGQEERRLKIVRENPASGRLEGEAFYLGVNKLPNSLRGRSDLATLADWLDLYDNYLFAEVERLNLLSAFVWDYKIDGADEKKIQDKLKAFPKPRPGQVFAHNEKETLEAQTPDLKAADRSEAGRMLRIHIAGSFGFPLSYLGEMDSNRATIEGQNDVLMKTPARRQKDFAALIDQIIRFTIEQTTGKNPALFRDAKPFYKITMPEIAAKDIARAGNVLTATVAAMDTAMANGTASRKLAVQVMVGMLKHLGVEADPQEVLDDAEVEAEERQARADELQAGLAARNAPVPGDDDGDEPPARGGKQEGADYGARLLDALVERSSGGPAPVHVTVHTPDVQVPITVKTGDTAVVVPAPGTVARETTHVRDANGLLQKSVTVERPGGPAAKTVKETTFERGDDGQLARARTVEHSEPDTPAGE